MSGKYNNEQDRLKTFFEIYFATNKKLAGPANSIRKVYAYDASDPGSITGKASFVLVAI